MKPELAQQLLKATVAQYNRIAVEFDSARSTASDFTALTRFVKPGDLVVDVACGNGRLAAAFADQEVRMIGTDGSKELITIARERYATEIEKGWLGFTVADIMELPFDHAQFDVCFFMAALHHVPSHAMRIAVMRDLKKIIKPGARVIGSVWNLRATLFTQRYDLETQLVTPRSGHDVGDVFIPWKSGGAAEERYCHAFTIEELQDLFTEVGFVIEELYPVDRMFEKVEFADSLNIFFVLRG